ncbi:MAG: Sec-independent protein translocase protein TatB [Pseudomonadota bacterium]
MFDIGFLELLLLSVIGLVVLGPERLPRAARTIGAYVAKARRTWTNVRMDIERELAAQDIKQHIQEPLDAMKEAVEDVNPAAEIDELRRNTEEAFREPAKEADEQSRSQ